MTTSSNKSLKKIVWSVIEQLTNYNPTDDIPWKEEWLQDQAHVFRSALIKEQLDNTNNLDESYYQNVSCLEIKCRNITCLSGSETIDSGVVENYIEIPKLVGGIGLRDIKYLGTVDYKVPFIRKNLFGYNTSDGDLYNRTKTVYTVVGNEIILKNLPQKGTKYVGFIAILDNPTTACDWNDEKEYPIPNFLIQKLELLMLKQTLSVSGIRPDYVSDGLPGNTSQPVQKTPNVNPQ